MKRSGSSTGLPLSEPASGKIRLVAGYLLIAVVGLCICLFRVGESLDHAVLDRGFAALRRLALTPVPAPNEVVIIGLDEQAFVTLPEPSSLWHPYLGKLFAALAAARPAVVGIDLALPVRSYDFLRPGYDQPLLAGMRELSQAAPLVIGRYLNGRRRFRPILPELVAAAGGAEPVSLTLCRDRDGAVRRIELNLCAETEERATLSGTMAQRLGLQQRSQGLINYAVGHELTYLPLLQVLDWINRGDSQRLRQAFAGRAVLIGSLFPTDERYEAPLALASWEPGNRMLHAVSLHAQALRSLLTKGLVQPLAPALVAVLALLAAASWFGAASRRKTLLFAAALILLPPLALLALWHSIQVPAASLALVALGGFGARLAYDGSRYYRQRNSLRSAFSGYVSPAVMKAIQGGRLRPNRSGERCHVAVLFADIRGFTERSEKEAAEALIALLNRYFAEMTAAIHSHGGIVDKLIGDGLMASFGTPQPLPLPERNALEAARDMLRRLARLNRQLAAAGQATLSIGIGVHCGEVLAGFVGSKKRNDYTLIGDAVNTASRLEGITKRLGYPIVCSTAVAEAVGRPEFLTDLGEQALRGHSPMRLYGWHPPDSA